MEKEEEKKTAEVENKPNENSVEALLNTPVKPVVAPIAELPKENQQNPQIKVISPIKQIPQTTEVVHQPIAAPQPANEEQEKNSQHKKVEKIVGMRVINDKRYFLVKYSGQRELAVVDGAIIRKHNQKVLLNFYEENIKLESIEQISETALSSLMSKNK